MFRKAVATVSLMMKYSGKLYTTTMKPIDCKVVVNHHVELTEEEKAEARKEAIKRAESEAYSRMTKRKTTPKKENGNNGQMTLLF